MNIKYANQDLVNDYESKRGDLLSSYELCTLNNGIEALNKLQTQEVKIDSDYRVRKAVDYMLTHEIIDLERFNVVGFFDRFAISDVELNLSDNERVIVGEIFNKVLENENLNVENIGFLSEQYREETLDVINEKEWQKNWKEETRINKIQEKGSEYFTLLKSYYGKIVLSVEEFEKAKEIYKQITSMDFYKKVFSKESSNIYEIIYKLPLYDKDDKTRVMIDALVVEIDNTTVKDKTSLIFTPYVFKFGKTPAIRFGELVDRNRYDMQAYMNDYFLREYAEYVYLKNFDNESGGNLDLDFYINKTKFIYARIDDFEEGVERPLPVQFTISEGYIYELYKIRNLRFSNLDTMKGSEMVCDVFSEYKKLTEDFKEQCKVNSKANDFRIVEQNFEVVLKLHEMMEYRME